MTTRTEEEPQRWEYVVIALAPVINEEQEMLDILGYKCWELVAVTTSSHGLTKAYLKRPYAKIY